MEGVLEQTQLAFPADERRLHAAAGRRSRPIRLQPHRTPDLDRFRLALERVGAKWCELDGGVEHVEGRLAHHDRAGLGDRLQPRRRVHHVTDDEAPLSVGRRNRCLAAQNPGANRQRLVTELGTDPGHGIDELQSCSHRPLRIVLVGDRRPPHGHDRIADELLDGAAEALDDLPGAIEVGGERRPHVFGVATLGERRETDEIGEQHDNEPSLVGVVQRLVLGLRGGCGFEREPARSAVLVATIVCGPAVGARLRERFPTFPAELPRRPVVGSAVRAHHRASSSCPASTAYRVPRPDPGPQAHLEGNIWACAGLA